MISSKDCLVLTGYDDNGAKIGDLTSDLMAKYAARHGFSFKCNRKYEVDTFSSWQKLGLVRRELFGYDLVLWMDMDVVVTNPLVDFRKISEYFEGLTFAFDWEYGAPHTDMFSAGVFIAKHCPRSFRFLDEAMTLTKYSKRENYITTDQGALREVYGSSCEWRDCVRVVPHHALNAVPTEVQPKSIDPWVPGNFLCHLTGIGNDRRVELFHKFAPKETK
jgi:hypothetical protein